MITVSSEESSLTKPQSSKLKTRIKTSSSTEIVGHTPDDHLVIEHLEEN